MSAAQDGQVAKSGRGSWKAESISDLAKHVGPVMRFLDQAVLMHPHQESGQEGRANEEPREGPKNEIDQPGQHLEQAGAFRRRFLWFHLLQ